MKIIHLNGFTGDERTAYKVAIFNNTISCIRSLVRATVDLGIEISAESQQASETIRAPEFEMLHTFPPELVQPIKTLWADPGIKQAFARASEFQLLDCAQHFLDDLDRISNSEFVPTVQDILACRTKTTGVSEVQFGVGTTRFRLVDVGGQRSERKKWMSCFPDVTAVMFVVAMSEYDLKLYEDNTTNRMFESLKLFKEICNNKYFSDTAMILFFNKTDIFKQKLEKVDLGVCFPDYKGKPGDYEDACQFLQDKFLSLNENPSKRVYVHFTCATDTQSVSVVFDACKDIVIQDLLQHRHAGGAG
eukprot:TRINITY_DN681_c0_g1_i10.p1 TRINITY_DN681_c0_g1~~TRINITY_DN681_c0_g1_i10.p1  ORF type:complete len:304 (-),score=86.43 TRINITY_DN681_c0_g1_i10:1896-2807(-)